MNMLAGNKRSRPIEDAELLKRTDELPTHQQYGAVWKQLTDMGHDEELVRMWATENEIITKGQEWYNRISAPVAMQHQDHIAGGITRPTNQDSQRWGVISPQLRDRYCMQRTG